MNIPNRSPGWQNIGYYTLLIINIILNSKSKSNFPFFYKKSSIQAELGKIVLSFYNRLDSWRDKIRMSNTCQVIAHQADVSWVGLAERSALSQAPGVLHQC